MSQQRQLILHTLKDGDISKLTQDEILIRLRWLDSLLDLGRASRDIHRSDWQTMVNHRTHTAVALLSDAQHICFRQFMFAIATIEREGRFSADLVSLRMVQAFESFVQFIEAGPADMPIMPAERQVAGVMLRAGSVFVMIHERLGA